jgi:D-serine deaminase-like pyridoxal phosphate-dependent protein
MSANTNAVGLRCEELETPALCLDLNAYRRNLARMAEFIIGRHQVGWRPHIKGLKAPELALEAIAAGAIGVTCATVYEAEVMVGAGVRDALLANQAAGARKLARLARLTREAHVITATDSETHADQLNAAAIGEGVVIPVLVEIDTGMGRSGVPPGDAAARIALHVATLGGLRFCGLMTWEGHAVPMEGAAKQAEIAAVMHRLAVSADCCRSAGLPVAMVSASGSATFQDAVPLHTITEVQAGGGALCDLNYRRWGVENEFAMTVLTRVISRPTPCRIIVDGGFKTMSFQHGLPGPIGLGPLKSMVLTAEHGILELEAPDERLRPGDTLSFVPGYTDSTVCLHDEMCVIRDGVVESVWAIPGRSGRR